jgi:hypothetical protein
MISLGKTLSSVIRILEKAIIYSTGKGDLGLSPSDKEQFLFMY